MVRVGKLEREEAGGGDAEQQLAVLYGKIKEMETGGGSWLVAPIKLEREAL